MNKKMNKKTPLDYIICGFITGLLSGFVLFSLFNYLITRLLQL